MSDMEYRIQRVEDAVISIKDSLQTLVKLEVHHGETRDALARAFQECSKLEGQIEQETKARESQVSAVSARVSEIEKLLPGLTEMRRWLVTLMLSTLGLVGLGYWGLLLDTKNDHASRPVIHEKRVGEKARDEE